MTKRTHIFSICAMLLLGIEAFSQHMLILQRGNNQKTRITYQVGEPLTYLQKELDYYITERIEEITPEYIRLSDNVLSLSQIVAIDIQAKDERNRTLRNLTLLPAAAAVLLLTAETVNSLYADGRLSYDRGSLAIAGILGGSSLLMSQLRYKKFRVRGRNKLLVITRQAWEDSL
nr:hypothetical protein [Cytophagales bacterium]